MYELGARLGKIDKVGLGHLLDTYDLGTSEKYHGVTWRSCTMDCSFQVFFQDTPLSPFDSLHGRLKGLTV